LREKFALLAKLIEEDLEVSVEFINGDNSYWTPTPLDEVEELGIKGIIDIGDDQTDFQKIVSLVHEVGHALFSSSSNIKNHKRILLFEESLAWYLGYNYALQVGVEIDLKEYADCVERALKLYAKELK
jgi:hypothetical protein